MAIQKSKGEPVSNAPVQLIYITCPNTNLAQSIARKLVDTGLIACANIIPEMQSIYKWQDQVCEDNEVILILKARKDNFVKIKETVLELHEYDCPCVVALDIGDGHLSYLNWVAGSEK